MARTLIKMPSTAKRGELIEIRTLISHPMETGYRPGADGKVLPRNIIRRFTCGYNGETVFSADLFPAVAANPNLIFYTVATESGTLTFTWEGDGGFKQTESVTLTVTG
ncbi:thiosulfate oxidation carrier complex protein SoxZ [Noviherbaspirillum sp. Root189]|uniref:thiosulfate oxidation carrier complex protein SoxZ n=1 Tax=Noviherbaspirillum sp. Root189 TaxID=1736487 RepID=UPI00070C90F4|nr:thiosulfate oxidation carrier complex protein SoxZ [Noviherbaspirillum sp. Root189]KRB68001.1 thiosulfate oxidation carrier complex protein SoxZ [Noviherbaspirillum sp. Root189]